MMLYIDPGTGSMLFTVLIGIIGAAVYSIKTFWMKLKFVLSGGKAEKNKNKILFVIFSMISVTEVHLSRFAEK